MCVILRRIRRYFAAQVRNQLNNVRTQCIVASSKGLMGKKTELEKLLDEAISNKNWGCSSTIKSRIARATFNYQDYSVVMKAVWTAIESKPYKWRIIFKVRCCACVVLDQCSHQVNLPPLNRRIASRRCAGIVLVGLPPETRKRKSYRRCER